MRICNKKQLFWMCPKFVLTLRKNMCEWCQMSADFVDGVDRFESPKQSQRFHNWMFCDFYFNDLKKRKKNEVFKVRYESEVRMADSEKSIVSKRFDYGEDCSSCRLVSGGGIIAMSIYVFTAAKQQKTNLSRNFVHCISLGGCDK